MINRNHLGSGSAHRGLGEWLMQRLSALYLAGFSVWLVMWLAIAAPSDYVAWKAWMATGGVRLAFALFFLSVLVHTWVGLRSVFLDYLKPMWVRSAAQLLLSTGLLALAFWVAQILLVDARA